MIRVGFLPFLVLTALVTGCVENTAPGNDREASLDPPSLPAELASVSEALTGVGTHLLVAEVMTEADVRKSPTRARPACSGTPGWDSPSSFMARRPA